MCKRTIPIITLLEKMQVKCHKNISKHPSKKMSLLNNFLDPAWCKEKTTIENQPVCDEHKIYLLSITDKDESDDWFILRMAYNTKKMSMKKNAWEPQFGIQIEISIYRSKQTIKKKKNVCFIRTRNKISVM